MQLELELRDHAEVAAAAARCPVEVGVFGRTRVQQLAVCSHDVDGLYAVNRHAELACNAAKATAKRQAAYARMRHGAERRDELMRCSCLINLPEQRATGRPNT